MEKINEFFNHVKERFSSPLFYSFIISWVFCNWEVTIALLWYDPAPSSKGHLSLIDFIREHTNNYKSLLYPFFLALAYSFLSPILKNVITAFNAWNSKWGEDWNLKILKGGKVSIDKYLAFKVQYEKRSAELEKAITSESTTQQQLEDTKTVLMTERNERNRLNQELSDARSIVDNINNVNILNGRWIRTLKTSMRTITENIEIQSSNVYIYNGNTMEQKYSIHDFYFNSKSKLVHFTLSHSGNEQPNYFFAFNQLTFRHRGFSGMEHSTNGSAEVSYSRDEEFEEELVESTEENQEITDRDYWLNKGTPETVKIADEVLELVNEIESGYSLKYNKGYIGMVKDAEVNNFAIYRPKKDYTRLELRIPKSLEVDDLINSAGLKQMEYEDKWTRYRIRLTKEDVKTHHGTLAKLLVLAKNN